MISRTRIGWCAAGVAGVWLALGCSQPQLIDRTQPNYFKKSDLEGTWYIQETIVDAPKTPNGTAAIGAHGKLEKIRWEIQEGLLVALRAYEIVPGADPRVDRRASRIGDVRFQDGRAYRGNPVFAYKILSHFDRQRQYNAATGEQSVVLEENVTDRPWYEREFMRVDWAQNVIQNVDSDCAGKPTDLGGCAGSETGLALRYVTSQDMNGVDQTMVVERDAEERLVYFDWTAQVIKDPRSIYYEGYGNIPYCYFNPTVDCESVDLRVRVSVKRVDEARVKDYEPLVYSDRLNKKFGLFRNEAFAYSKDYGYTYSGQQFFAMRHNIWAQARRTDGAVIPIVDRPLRPMVYYMTENTPEFLWRAASQAHASAAGADPVQTIEASWDRAFRRAVAVPRGIEVADVTQMFYVCESPVRDGAPEACGKAGTYARVGDLRYNVIPYVDQDLGGVLGFGPSSMDPETGEVVHAAANVFGPAIDTWAGASMEVMDVLSGQLTLGQLVTGEDIKDYVQANFSPTDPRRPKTGPWKSEQGLLSDPTKPLGAFAGAGGRLRTLAQQWGSKGSPPLALENRRATVDKRIRDNPSLALELVGLPEVRAGVEALSMPRGFREKLKADPEFFRTVAVNVLLGKDPIEKARAEEKNASTPELGCYYEYSYEDEDYVGIAKRKLDLQNQLAQAYKSKGHLRCAAVSSCTDAEARSLAREEVFNSLRREAYRSVSEHEIGHTVGLRHNFIGSADALNYQDGYWDLRKDTIGVEVAGRRVLPTMPQNLIDAAKPNQRQIDASMSEYAYSSIMDYGARVTSQNRGLGKYDEAAILFAYAGGAEPGWVEVFNQTRSNFAEPNVVVPVDNQAKIFTVRGAHVELPVAHVEHYTPVSPFYTDKFHYSTLPLHFAESAPTLEAMVDSGIERLKSRSFRKWSEMSGYYTKLEAAIREYNLSEGGFSTNQFNRARDIVALAGTQKMPIEVPFMFCTDSEVGANLLCNRHDQGADVYEMTSKWIERFNSSYVFSNFRRHRLTYSPASTASSKFSRYLGNIPNVYQQWLYSVYNLIHYYQITPEAAEKYYGLGDPIWQNYWTMAVVDSTNLLMQQLSVPSVGYHGKRSDGGWEYLPLGDPENRRLSGEAEVALRENLRRPEKGGYLDVVYIPRGPGRSMFTRYDSTGYDFFDRVNETGHFWDVYAAMLALTTSDTNFLGVDRGSDALRYSLPYYLLFNRELASLFGHYWTQDASAFSASVVKQADGTGLVQLPVFLRAQDYIPGFEYPLSPPAPLDVSGQAMPWEKVAPVSTWSARYYSQVWSMAFFTVNFNLEYANFNQVYRLGSGDNLTPSPGFDVVRFEDPFGGGAVYAALLKTGEVNPPAGATMVRRAAELRAKWEEAKGSPPQTPPHVVDGRTADQWEADVREATRTLEMMRGLFDIFGRTW